MDISHETPETIDQRLRRVIAAAHFDTLAGTWFWDETSAHLRDDAVAIVTDGASRSQLVPVGPGDDPDEPVGLFSFHFPDRTDNSGFVGWLATQIKTATGSGVFVVCGSNSQRGGIYDYWGYPEAACDAVIDTVNRLRTTFTTAPPQDGGSAILPSAQAE
jgi:hypothetical protein